jgi:protein phosphatase
MKQPAAWNDCLQHAEITDIGMRRQNNQDSLAAMPAADEASWRQRGHLFMVADGMGAHAAGELASKLACDGVPHNYSKMRDVDPVQALELAIRGANAEIHRRGQAEAGFHGMGTTCCVLLLLPEGAIVGHVGDSRIYRLRGEQLEQLTFDHSLVWELRAAGQLGGAAESMPKNIITRSLGPNPAVQIDLEGPLGIRPGDVFLLCSDGLTGPVNDTEIGAILGSLPTDEAARMLVDLANLRGGPDNISVIVARVVAPPVATEADPESGSPPRKGLLVALIAWAVAAACLAGAGAMLVGGMKLAAGVAAAGATIAIVVALSQRGESATTDDGVPMRAPLGRAPYVRLNCRPTAEVVKELSGVAHQLRQAAEDQKWQVEWDRFEGLRSEAEKATAGGDFAAAVAAHGRSITLIVDDLRRRRGELKRTSDSDVNLL